ncbi:MAG TPA: ABC transporter ATP-binding protein [Steroidobacteraceae bacterium]|jgi:peptide/nickel transport system ATP-binding protein|nr:ABC transporter ATP-binding protein [Steroidobacteraceae bacterium]
MRLARSIAVQADDETVPILAVERLSIALPKGADRAFAVEDASLELRRGEILCVVGESGSGKSALSGAIMGAPASGLKVVGGSVRLKGQELTKLSERAWCRIRGNRIAMIFQEPMASLNPAVPVGLQIMEVFELHAKLSVAERRERALALIRSMQLPDPERIAASFPHQLSGGQCQRVIIAMALAMNPEVLIADEPTTALDVTTQAQVLKLIRELRTLHGHTILFITHDFGVVAEIADRIAVMRHGRIIEMGEARQVLTQPQHPYTRELLAAVPSLVPPTDQGEVMAPAAKPVLAVTGLAKSYGRVHAVNEISFDLERGTTLSIVGESGCGKSSLARILVRLTAPTAGRVDVNGKCFLTLTGGELRSSCRAVQMIFQDPFGSLNPLRTAGAVIARAAVLAGADVRTARERAGELFDRVGLPREGLQRRPAAFSGGQKQRIGIARALAMNPDVLIADESLSALDASSQAQILALLRKLQNELGLAILLITHDLRVAAQISHRIAVMQAGRIVEIGPAGRVINSPEHPYTRELLESAPGRGLV